MADRADQEAEDEYASDEYEAESPARAAPVENAPPPAAAPALSPLAFADDGPGDEIDASKESAAEGATPRQSTARGKSTRSRRRSPSTSGRHLLDNTPWTFTVWASHVRGLRIPVAESGALRELRVFATLDKQAAQSRGSTWRHELQSSGAVSPFPAPGQRRGSLRSLSSAGGKPAAGWSSGLIEEAKWLREDGKLQWTFPMERFRRLKAYSPRIKAFVYGIRENAMVAEHSRPLAEDLARQEKEESIVSFGWFFLDLRTPDLPKRWMKLSNSPFGGEVQLSTTFSPVKSNVTAPPTPLPAQVEGKLDSTRQSEQAAAQGVNRITEAPLVVAGEDGEYLRIGDSKGTDVFVISVFVRSAVNLTELVQAAMGAARLDVTDGAGFWLSYSLFDVVVQTDVFHNLGIAEFPPIRDSFRVQSSLGDLRHFLEATETFSVFLCTENNVLAGVDIHLGDLLSCDLFSSMAIASSSPTEGEKATVDGKFPFPGFGDATVAASIAVECVRSQQPISQVNDPGTLGEMESQRTGHAGVSVETHDQIDAQAESSEPSREEDSGERVTLRLDNLRLSNSILTPLAGLEGVLVELTVGDARVTKDATFYAFLKNEALASSPELEVSMENVSRKTVASIPIEIRCISSTSQSLIAISSGPATFMDSDEGIPESVVLPLVSEASTRVGECVLKCAYCPDTRHSDQRPDTSADEIAGKRVYRVFLRMKSVRDLAVPAGSYSLAYQDPFSSSASITSERFQVQQKGEVVIPDLHCTFERTKNHPQLKKEMEAVVAIVLVSHEGDRQGSVVGSAAFSLNYLFFSEEQFCCTDASCAEVFRTEAAAETHWAETHTVSARTGNRSEPATHFNYYRSCSITIPLVGTGGESASNESARRLGSIRVIAYLEDLGPVERPGSGATMNRVIPQLITQPITHMRQKSPPVRTAPVLWSAPLGKSPAQPSASPQAYEREEAPLHSPHGNVDPILVEARHWSDSEQIRARGLREKIQELDELKQSLQRDKDAWEQEHQLQQLQWKRRLAEMEKARMDELEEEWARREEERSALLRSAQGEYQGLEQTLRSSLADLEARERRITVAEAALQREQRTQREENEFLRKRLKSEQTHALSLAKKQTEAYERRIALLETQLGEAEKRAKQVEDDFTEYRQQQRKVPEARLREQIAALKGNVAELEKQKMTQERACEVAEANGEKLKSQLEKMAKLVLEERKKHENQAVEELEKLRVKYIAREEKYVLDGDRDELRAIKKQLDDLRGLSVRRRTSTSTTREHRHARESASSQSRYHERTVASEHVHAIRRNPSQPPDRSSFSSDQESEMGRSIWQEDEHSVVEAGHGEVAPPRKYGGERQGGSSTPSSAHSRADEYHHNSESVEASDAEAEAQTTPIRSLGVAGSELARLQRERKLLLASGAYDTQSYLVCELDRLIRITRARAQHQSPEG